MTNPYETLDIRSFWKPAVGSRNCLELDNLWKAKISIDPADKVVTAGSCFAQHIGRALAKSGFNWFDAEPGPGSADLNRKYGYGVFSFRTGNIYTCALLEQWIQWALNPAEQSDEAWVSDARAYDPFRPAIEPGGFASVQEMLASRAVTLEAILRAITEAKVFVFTMGLTEGWVNLSSGVAYAMCPGTLAGTFEPTQHGFRNYRYKEIEQSMRHVIRMVQSVNPDIKFLLTVSPVPLTATASDQHVLVATTYSKSVLRAVAGDIAQDMDCVDYFPSYEIITSPVFRGMFFAPNQREVSLKGVEHVMGHFFGGMRTEPKAKVRVAAKPPVSKEREGQSATPPAPAGDDVECEEALLEAFSPVTR